MSDIAHLWGNDLSFSPTGDLAIVDAVAGTQQRVLRRLLTNPGDYIWSLDFGAGLAGFVGAPGAAATIRAAIRGQIFKELGVARVPEPIIELQPNPAGRIYVHIRYADAGTSLTQTVALTA